MSSSQAVSRLEWPFCSPFGSSCEGAGELKLRIAEDSLFVKGSCGSMRSGLGGSKSGEGFELSFAQLGQTSLRQLRGQHCQYTHSC